MLLKAEAARTHIFRWLSIAAVENAAAFMKHAPLQILLAFRSTVAAIAWSTDAPVVEGDLTSFILDATFHPTYLATGCSFASEWSRTLGAGRTARNTVLVG